MARTIRRKASHTFETLFRASVSTPLGSIGDASHLRFDPTYPCTQFRVLGHYCLMLLLEGQGHVSVPGEPPVSLRPGDAVLTLPTRAIRYGPPRGHSWTEIYVVFEGPVFDAVVQASGFNPLRPIRHLAPVTAWECRFREAIPARIPGSVKQHMAQVMRLATFITEVLGEEDLSAQRRAWDGWVASARFVLEHNLQDDVNLRALATDHGLAYETFRKRITRELGMPPARYRLQRRISVAQELLATTDMTGKEIGTATGLGNEFEFSRHFKRVTGMSPRTYRARFSDHIQLTRPSAAGAVRIDVSGEAPGDG